MSVGKTILGTLAGFAVGAIAGILFAPEKGSVTRRQIMDKGDEYADELKSKFDEYCDTIAEKIASTKKDVENLAEKGKAKYDNAKNSASEY